MLELYQIRRYHQNSKFSSGSDSDEEPPEPSKFDKINSEFSSVVDGSLGNSEEITIRKIIEGSSYKNFSKLHCKVIGLKTCQSMDGVDFLLNKRDVKVKYLNDGDELEILWLDLDNKATKRSFTHNYNRCEIIKTIGKVYLIRNYKITKKNRVGFGRGRILKKEDSEKYADPDFNKFSTAIEATPFAKSQNSYTFNQNSTDIYALKSMSKAMISQFKQADHVMNEKEIMNSLDHPFIIKMHYSFSTKNYLNLVLDY